MTPLQQLIKAAEDLYFAGYWHCDRQVDEQALWTALRDAAGIPPGHTAEMLGPDRSTKPAMVGEAMFRDAMRYRWLRVHSTKPAEPWSTHTPESFDEMVDEEMGRRSATEEKSNG